MVMEYVEGGCALQGSDGGRREQGARIAEPTARGFFRDAAQVFTLLRTTFEIQNKTTLLNLCRYVNIHILLYFRFKENHVKSRN